MRQVKSNIFNGDSYKAIFARAIYKRLMSREWVTLAEIMSDYLGEPCENPSKEEHYGELKKAFGEIKVLIIEKVGKDSIEVEGNNRSAIWVMWRILCPTCTIMVGLSVI